MKLIIKIGIMFILGISVFGENDEEKEFKQGWVYTFKGKFKIP